MKLKQQKKNKTARYFITFIAVHATKKGKQEYTDMV
jgi:hypothetical protein